MQRWHIIANNTVLKSYTTAIFIDFIIIIQLPISKRYVFKRRQNSSIQWTHLTVKGSDFQSWQRQRQTVPWDSPGPPSTGTWSQSASSGCHQGWWQQRRSDDRSASWTGSVTAHWRLPPCLLDTTVKMTADTTVVTMTQYHSDNDSWYHSDNNDNITVTMINYRYIVSGSVFGRHTAYFQTCALCVFLLKECWLQYSLYGSVMVSQFCKEY